MIIGFGKIKRKVAFFEIFGEALVEIFYFCFLGFDEYWWRVIGDKFWVVRSKYLRVGQLIILVPTSSESKKV